MTFEDYANTTTSRNDSTLNRGKKKQHPVYSIGMMPNTHFLNTDLESLNAASLLNNQQDIKLNYLQQQESIPRGFLSSLFKSHKHPSKFELEAFAKQKNQDNHFQSMLGLLVQFRAVCKVTLEN